MNTCCPHCQTIFKVDASQLRAAHGQVRCGSCRSVFDGVGCLVVDAQPEAGGSGARQFIHGESVVLQEPERQADSVPNAPPVLAAKAGAAESGVPEVLRDDIARSRTARRFGTGSLTLTVVALLLLAGLGAQFAWFHPAGVLAGYPEARPVLEKFCAVMGCALPDRRDPSRIQMLARDVRIHPEYEGAMLVSATLVNVAAHAQPYPRIRFSVFNVNGQTIASRVFEPKEYLSPDVDAAGEMIPGRPLQLTIELLAPEEAAVSYEFRFL